MVRTACATKMVTVKALVSCPVIEWRRCGKQRRQGVRCRYVRHTNELA